MLTILRFAATLAALAPLAAFRDAFGVKGRNWADARHGARLALFAVEVALVVSWALAKLFRQDRAFLPGAAEWLALVAGAVLAIVSTRFAADARRRLGRMFSPTFGVLQDHALITDGPYGVTRHPVYTGVIGFFTGLALLWNSGATFLLAILVIAPLLVHTWIEERLFAAHFGDVYAAYRRRVPRLVPGWKVGATR